VRASACGALSIRQTADMEERLCYAGCAGVAKSRYASHASMSRQSQAAPELAAPAAALTRLGRFHAPAPGAGAPSYGHARSARAAA